MRHGILALNCLCEEPIPNFHGITKLLLSLHRWTRPKLNQLEGRWKLNPMGGPPHMDICTRMATMAMPTAMLLMATMDMVNLTRMVTITTALTIDT